MADDTKAELEAARKLALFDLEEQTDRALAKLGNGTVHSSGDTALALQELGLNPCYGDVESEDERKYAKLGPAVLKAYRALKKPGANPAQHNDELALASAALESVIG